MTEEIKNKEEEKKEDLVNMFYELGTMKRLLRGALYEENKIDYSLMAVLNLLTGITIKKLEYYHDKYRFEVDSADLFYVEDVPQFITFQSKKEATGEEVSANE